MNSAVRSTSKLAGAFALAVLALLCLAQQGSAPLHLPVTDFFHEGEYLNLGEHVRAYVAGTQAYPVLIHGAMDYLPQRLAAWIDADSVIVYTRLVNGLLGAVSLFLFCVLLHLLLDGLGPLTRLGLALAAIPVFSAGPGADIVSAQQAPLGLRETFVLLTLLLIVLREKRLRGATAWTLLAGTAMVLATGWSYDRGLAAVLATFAWIAVMAMRRDLRGIGWVAGGMALGVAILAVPVMGGWHHLDNLVYWLCNAGEVWQQPAEMKTGRMVGAAPGIALCAVAVVSTVLQWGRGMPEADRGFTLALLGAQLVMGYKLLGFPLVPHSAFALWPSVLLLCHLYVDLLRRIEAEIVAYGARARGPARLFVAALACAAVFPYFATVPAALRNLQHGVLADTELMGETVATLANALAPNDCVFDFTNEGLVTFAARKTNCSDYPYGVYIAPDRQAEVIDQLERRNLVAIVSRDEGWQFNMLNRPMDERLPLIAAYIERHYPEVEVVGGHRISRKAAARP
ncbi:MAG: hypothetical protein ABI605_08365 [Rhizobacter sp.]